MTNLENRANSQPSSALLAVDRAICGENQVPAELHHKLSGNTAETERLARGRVKVASGAGMEVAGKGLVTFGLSVDAPPAIFVLGMALSISGYMLRSHNKNENGSMWNLLLHQTLGRLGPHRNAVKSALIDAGVMDEEANSIDDLPLDLYNAELSASNVERFQNVGTPLSSGAAMLAYGDYVTGTVVAGLGLSAFPLGEHFYKESNLVRAAKSRAGRSAKLTPYIRKIQEEHIAMTDKLNLLSHTPEMLFTIKYLFGAGNALPALYGLQAGLEGLSGVLSSQRSRESTKRTTEVATHLINALSNKPFIATPQRWEEHVNEVGISQLYGLPFQDGLVIRNFEAQLPSGNKASLAPMSLDASAGSATILRAESGSGKSVTLMGLMHLFEHTGSIHIIKNGIATDVHELSSPEELAKKVLLITEDGVNGTDRVADLFRNYFLETHQELYDRQSEKYDPTYVNLAWKIADNMLEKEIEKIEKAEAGVFPRRMVSALKEIRQTRNGWINSHLQEHGGNISAEGITAQRIFSSLSAGEKRRMLVVVASAAAKTAERVAVILDEPLAHLDSKNRQLQLDALKRMQECDSNIALIIVSHENIEELQASLNNCQVKYLERNGK